MNKTRPFINKLFIAVLTSLMSLPLYAQKVIVAADVAEQHHVELLIHALAYADLPYDVVISGLRLPKKRAFQQLEKGTELHVVAGSLSDDRAAILSPIPIPLLKGLLGWRINLISENTPDILKEVESLEDLKRLSGGSYHSWSDTKVLEQNGLKILKSDNVQTLFKMLARNRFDYFPRSALKISDDFNQNNKLSIVIDPHLLLKYPHAYVFYVNKNEAILARDIESGLLKAINDGSFDMIFNRHYGAQVQKLVSESRQVIELDNRQFLLPELLKIDKFWLDPITLIDNANTATTPKKE